MPRGDFEEIGRQITNTCFFGMKLKEIFPGMFQVPCFLSAWRTPHAHPVLRTGALAPVLAELMTYCHDLTMFCKAGEMPSREFEEAGRGWGGAVLCSPEAEIAVSCGVSSWTSQERWLRKGGLWDGMTRSFWGEGESQTKAIGLGLTVNGSEC